MPPLYSASVPVFLHYLERLRGLLAKVEGREEVLQARLAPDMFTTGQQIATAAGLALRTASALAGQAVPKLAEPAPDGPGLLARIGDAEAHLRGLDPADFAAPRRIRHRAGFAELDQDAETFLHLFGMPNFMFHTCMAFAILRAKGVKIGKADFDGQHDYPHGFRF